MKWPALAEKQTYCHVTGQGGGNPAQASILNCDSKIIHAPQDRTLEWFSPILCSMANHRFVASLVACRAAPCGRPMDRSTDNRSAHPAPLAGLDSPHAVSGTIQIRSAQPDLARSPARCHRRGRLALLPAPWLRLARDPTRCRRRYGRRSHARRFHPYAATCKKPILGTGRSFLRKGAEATLVPVAEVVLGKQRILELYLNVVEWGPGIYGAESACHYYDRTSARNIGREQSARLAAILPAPLKRRPERMNNYSAVILRRMRQVGW